MYTYIQFCSYTCMYTFNIQNTCTCTSTSVLMLKMRCTVFDTCTVTCRYAKYMYYLQCDFLLYMYMYLLNSQFSGG